MDSYEFEKIDNFEKMSLQRALTTLTSSQVAWMGLRIFEKKLNGWCSRWWRNMLSRGGLLKKLRVVRLSIFWDTVICVSNRTHLAQADACVCEDRRRHEGLLVSLSGLRVSWDRLLRHSSVARGTAQVPRRDVPESVSVTDYKYPPVGERLLISAYLAGLRVRSRLLNKAPFLRRFKALIRP